ncbi:putative cytochrome b [Trypanosoma grayi]|uniref:putative cytochrome b n=1 Tax=Trypanosoma grayi TaxID=71804 RepID=UPI0004F4B04C|nr:putative cytochrome b [Trypanosoma grayi]KEG08472.1 putative cytochrome b [Trypanosoma grayi]
MAHEEARPIPAGGSAAAATTSANLLSVPCSAMGPVQLPHNGVLTSIEETGPLVGNDTFSIPASPQIVCSIPRCKLPRRIGCSLRDWSTILQKQQHRRLSQQQQQHSHHGHHAGSHHHRQHYPQSKQQHGEGVVSKPFRTGQGALLPKLTIEEVGQHNQPDDLWLVVHGVVYDCTKFQHFHPGGEMLLRRCAGKDCTALYDYYHAWVSCESMLGPFAVGVVEQRPKERY